MKAGFFTSDYLIIRIFNYCPDCAPPGRTLVQVMIESAWHPWKDLHDDKDAYKAEKEKTTEEVLKSLNATWPGIQNQVEMINMATPYTWWRFTRNRQGAYEGFAVTPKIFTTQVKRSIPGLGNFFMAGQWVVPGGGVIPVLVSGKHAAMLLCQKDGKSFQTMFAN